MSSEFYLTRIPYPIKTYTSLIAALGICVVVSEQLFTLHVFAFELASVLVNVTCEFIAMKKSTEVDFFHCSITK